MAGDVRVQMLDGRWQTIGTDYGRAIWAENPKPSSDSWGPQDFNFELKREPGISWPDLFAFTPVEYWEDGRKLWSGRIKDTPTTDAGAETKITVNCEGMQYHLDDDQYQGLWVDTKIANFKDLKEYNNWDMNIVSLTGQINSTEGELSIGWGTGEGMTISRFHGVTYDAGPDNRFTRVAWLQTLVAQATAAAFYVRCSNLPTPYSISSYEDLYSLGNPPAGLTSHNRPVNTFGGWRYLHFFLYSGSTTTSLPSDNFIKLKRIRIFTERASTENNFGTNGRWDQPKVMLTASDVVKDVVQKAAPLITTPKVASPAYYDEVIGDQPKFYFRMNEETQGTFKDEVSGVRMGATNFGGTPTLRQPGPLDEDPTSYSMYYNGASKSLIAPNDQSIMNMEAVGSVWTNALYDGRSIEFFFKANSISSVQRIISLDTAGYLVRINGTALEVYWSNANGNWANIQLTGANLVANQWYHVVTTKGDNGLLTIYLNGGFNTSTGGADTPYVRPSPYYGTAIGAHYQGGASVEFFTGYVAEFSGYPYAMSLGQVKRHYDAAMNRQRGTILRTQFKLPEYAPPVAISPREHITAVNAVHDYVTKVNENNEMVFAPKPPAAQFEVGDWSAAKFDDASFNSSAEMANKVTIEGKDEYGADLRVIRTAADIPNVPYVSDRTPQPVNADFQGTSYKGSGWPLTTVNGAGDYGTFAAVVSTNASMILNTALSENNGWTTYGNPALRWFAGIKYRYRVRLKRTAAAEAKAFAGTSSFTISVKKLGVVVGNRTVFWSELNAASFTTFEFDFILPVGGGNEAAPRIEIVSGSWGWANLDMFYMDSQVVSRSAATIPDRMGFVRAKTLTIQSAMTQGTMEQMGDIWLRNHMSTPLKGTLSVQSPTAVREIMSGRPVPPSELLLHTGKKIRFNNRIDPDTGGYGRDGTIASVGYDPTTGESSVEIDNERKSFEAMLSRYDLIVGSR